MCEANSIVFSPFPRVRRDRRDRALVRSIVLKTTSEGRSVGSLMNVLCQGCGELVVVDLRADLLQRLQWSRTCEQCQERSPSPPCARFCQLCGADAEADASLELVGEICAGCARRVDPRELPRVLELAARTRFVDRFCRTRADLLRLDRALEDERYHEELQREDPVAVRRGYARFVRRLGSIQRELGFAWTPPPAPDADAPAVTRRLDVLVARILRAPTDIFVRNALLAVPRAKYVELIQSLRSAPEWWPTRVAAHAGTLTKLGLVEETLRLTDRFGRSAFVAFKVQPAFDIASGRRGAEAAGEPETRELWNVFPTAFAATAATSQLVSGLSRAIDAAREDVDTATEAEPKTGALLH